MLFHLAEGHRGANRKKSYESNKLYQCRTPNRW
nr:MAG TPA: hypothetical protein [Caudoviricetes sp.]